MRALARPSSRKFTVADLFSGAGGLSLGFLAEGFDVVAAFERDADAAETYRSLHRYVPGSAFAKVHEQDVCEVDFHQYRGLSVIVGGPPCQPWSLGGLRHGHADPRDGVPQFARALLEAAPLCFVMENVAGLTRGTARSAFEVILGVLSGRRPLRVLLGRQVGRFDRLNYEVSWQVLQAADFGVAQNRQRLFVVGLPSGQPFSWPTPTHGPGRAHPHLPAGDLIGHGPCGEPNPNIVTYASKPSLRPSPYHGQLYNGGGRPIDLTKPAPTLVASMGGNKTPWVDTAEVVPAYHAHLMAGGRPGRGRVPGARRITVAEAATLQGFPADARFAGTRSSQYRQIGNAVPPLLARAVAHQVALALMLS